MSKAFIELALRTLSCNQKELAEKLNVSPTQISKWKQGEHMSYEMKTKLREVMRIDDRDPDFVLLAGSVEAADKWSKLIHFLADIARDNAETGYDTYPLADEGNFLCGDIMRTLSEMGVTIPKKFPAELEPNYENCHEELLELMLENPYAKLMYDIFSSLTDVYGFYVAFVQELVDDEDLNLEDTPADNIEPCLTRLAACKVEVDADLAKKLNTFKSSVTRDYVKWLSLVKLTAIKAGVPIRAELLDLVYRSSDEIGEMAESESFGLNSTKLHPDIYMNELLTGMRILHQVLPFILKKMGVHDEFKLDLADLHVDYTG